MKQYLPYVLYALIVVALIAGIFMAFNAKDSTPKPKNTASTSQQDKQKQAEANKEAEAKRQQAVAKKPETAGNAADQAKPAYTPPASNQPAPTASGEAQKLADSGPEHVAALFMIVTLGSAWAFSRYQARSLSV